MTATTTRLIGCCADITSLSSLRSVVRPGCYLTKSVRMYQIKDVTTEEIKSSNYIHPLAVHYTQNGIRKRWDTIKSHDSVSILIHNITRDVFVFVKQFRPAVYMCQARDQGETTTSVNTSTVDPSRAFTLELCAGILDKAKSIAEIAVEEVLEECGYAIDVGALEKIVKARSSVGISGSEQTMFYVQVSDAMKTEHGGGNPAEGEMIEIVEVPVSESLQLAMSDDVERPMGLVFAILWYFKFKAANVDAQKLLGSSANKSGVKK